MEFDNNKMKPSENDHYKSLLDSIPEMVSIIELVYNEKGQPIDFYTRDLNLPFAKLLNKTKEELLNKKITSVISAIEDYWLESFASADKTGKPIQFKSYNKELDRHYFVSAWKISDDKVGVSFTSITESEKAKIALKEQSFKLQKTIDELDKTVKNLANQNKEKDKQAAEKLIISKENKEQRENEIIAANKELNFHKEQKDKKVDELIIANKEIIYQQEEKVKRANEKKAANEELDFQKEQKEQRAEELIIAKKELAFQQEEKVKRANEKKVAGEELDFQKEQKEQRAEELIIAKKEKEKRAEELIIAREEIDFQKEQKEQRAEELIIAKKEKEKRAVELIIANKELAYQKEQKDKRANELIIANKEKKNRLEELVIARELKQFIETSNTPVFGIDNMGVINEWNQACEKVTGYKKNEVLGVDWMFFNSVASNLEMKKIINLALKGKQSPNFEFITISKKGAKIVLLVNANTRWNALGEIQGVLAVGQDITELVGYRNELEKKVEERTIKLNQALEKQKELNKLKSKFVSTASHEFRTPLSAIIFAAGSMKKYWSKMEPAMIEKKLDKIENQVQHMTGLLDDILTVGKAEANKIKNNPLEINLGSFIEDIIEEVYTSRKKSHKIEFIDVENIKNTTILIDEKLGRNIFTNLISNAIKYSPNGKKIIIEISTEKKYILISVTDFGIGISPKELKTIFTPFSRGKNVDLIQGTGLGLTIAKEALNAMKGKITVKSTINKGASFIVRIPKN